MRQFSVCIEGDAAAYEAWENSGFIHFDAVESDEGPDALVLPASPDAAAISERIASTMPKLFIVMTGYMPPAPLAENYTLQSWTHKGMNITVGTLLETALPDPPRPEYGDDWQKAIAGTVYRYLLQDLFRETADWCGHMSSVVRRF